MSIVEGAKCVIRLMAAKQPTKPTKVRPVMNYKNWYTYNMMSNPGSGV